MLSTLQRRLLLGGAALGSIGAMAAAVVFATVGAPEPARAQAAPPPVPACQCAAAVEVQGGGNPMSPRGWITNCQCGAQSCAVLNGTALQCSR